MSVKKVLWLYSLRAAQLEGSPPEREGSGRSTPAVKRIFDCHGFSFLNISFSSFSLAFVRLTPDVKPELGMSGHKGPTFYVIPLIYIGLSPVMSCGRPPVSLWSTGDKFGHYISFYLCSYGSRTEYGDWDIQARKKDAILVMDVHVPKNLGVNSLVIYISTAFSLPLQRILKWKAVINKRCAVFML